jgi:DNA-directed RNA polymerase specialized sigma24 family protein
MDYIKSQYDISDWEMDFNFLTEEEIKYAYKYLAQYMWSTFKVNDKETVHKAILRAMRHADQFDPSRSSKWTWMSMICRNVYLSKDSRSNALRKTNSLDDKMNHDTKKTFAEMLADDSDDEELDDMITISREVKWLVENGKYPYLQLRMTGMRYDSIKDIMGVDLVTVKNRIYNERRLLKKHLMEFGSRDIKNHLKSRK